MTKQKWIRRGLELGDAARKLEWETAAWWNAGQKYGDRVKIVKDPNWKGPTYETCRAYAKVADKFADLGRRLPNLPFHHHHAVAHLKPETADRLLARASRQVEETKNPPPVRTMRQWAKEERRAEREQSSGQQQANANADRTLDKCQFGVVYLDPPWDYETWSEAGKDRAAANHYGTLSIDAIRAREPPVTKDAVVFMWSTIPIHEQAMQLLRDWGFTFKSLLIWRKPGRGTGIWQIDNAEILLIATVGEPVAPAQGTQPLTIIDAPKGQHSEKPEIFAELIENWYPNTPKLEMYARPPFRPGWTVWGNKVPGGMMEVPPKPRLKVVA